MQTPPQNHSNSDLLQVKTTAPLIDRGLTVEECKTLCTSPLIPVREKAYFRVLHETGLRPMEALNLQIENFNKETGSLWLFGPRGRRQIHAPDNIQAQSRLCISQHVSYAENYSEQPQGDLNRKTP